MMNDSERDPAVMRAIDELRRLPRADQARVRQIVATAAALRITPPGDESYSERRLRPRAWRLAGVGAAAAIVGFLIHGLLPARNAPVAVDSLPSAVAGGHAAGPAANVAVNASARDGAALPIPHQFVLNLRGAKRVAVVGDFNEWNRASAPMTHSADGTLWSATIPVLPGRHMYGFMVDDSLFMLDPGEPKARDPDLGAVGSVVIVGAGRP